MEIDAPVKIFVDRRKCRTSNHHQARGLGASRWPSICRAKRSCTSRAASILEPEHFFEPVHAQIFEWLRDMRSRGQRTSAAVLIAQLGQLGHIDILGLPLSVFVARLLTEG